MSDFKQPSRVVINNSTLASSPTMRNRLEEQQARERAYLEGEDITVSVPNDDDIVNFDTTPQEVTPTPMPKREVSVPNSNTITIALPNRRTRVEISYTPVNDKQLRTFGPDSSKFVVEFAAVNVSIADNSISLLTDNSFQVFPPILKSLELKISDVVYHVQYVGGSHDLGEYKQTTFIRIHTGDGETGSSQDR